MSQGDQVEKTLKEVLDLANRCFEAEKSDGYGVLIGQIEELEGQARAAFQSRIDSRSLVQKLRKAQPLTPEELNTLQLLVVGDAKYYLKYETDFDHWKSELKRVVAEISKLQATDLDVEGLMHLRALCREANRFLPDISFYLEQKERSQKFEEATRGSIDQYSGKFLADIVQEMMSSDKM